MRASKPAQSSPQKRILIIGGGTGLTTAYMLEHMPQFKVTLAEKTDRIGGHIHSADFGDHGMAELGAEFIGPPAAYPNVHRLFADLGVELQPYELNAHVHRINIRHGDEHIVFPPVYFSTAQSNETTCCDFFGARARQSKLNVDHNTLLTQLDELLKIQSTIIRAKSKAAPMRIDEVETLEEFIERFKQKTVFSRAEIDSFANKILYPMIAAAWGIAISEAKKFCAHYALNYLTLNKTWYDAPRGLSSYMTEMRNRSRNLDVRLKTEVVKLSPVYLQPGNKPQYHAQLRDGSVMLEQDGSMALFDDVVISTPAFATKDILPNINVNEMNDLRAALEAVRYYETTLVFHTDKNYETPKQTVVHTRVEGDFAANTAQKDWKARNGKTPIMKTWVLPGQAMPQPVANEPYYVQKHFHPYMGREYFIAQEALRRFQEKYNLRFGAILGGGGDSHEDATVAALKSAKSICDAYHCTQENQRLSAFLEHHGNVIEENNQLSTQTDRETERAWCCC